MSSQIAVSVIIAAYNAEPYVNECLDSIVNQSLRNIEIIFVNDGSTDRTVDIARSYARKDSRIIILDEKNEGAAAARNKGLAIARGQYLSILDADDIFDRKMLEKSYAHARKHDADIVIFKFNIINMRDNTLTHNYGFYKKDVSENTNLAMPALGFSDTNPASWNKLFKKSFIDSYEIKFQNLTTCNDITFTRCALVAAKKIYYKDIELLTYRTGINNTSKNRFKNAENIITASTKIKEFITKNNISEDIINSFYDATVSNFIWECSQFINNEEIHDIKEKMINFLPLTWQKKMNAKVTPAISVIVPVYNVEKFLGACLDSLLSQTFSDIEIICVNDGSTDNSLNILNDYADKYNNIRIISTLNKGPGHARNTGVREAKAPYIFFIDSDDWLDSTCLEKLYASIRKEDSDICIYGLQKYDEINNKYITDNYFDLSCYGNSVLGSSTYKDIKQSIFMRFGPVLKIYKKEFFIKNNLFFDEGVFYEDVFTHVKSIISADKISFCNEQLYFYRINREGSIMTEVNEPKKITDIYIYLKNVEDFLRQRKVFEELEYFFFKFMFEQLSFHSRRQTVLKDFFVNNTISYLAQYDICNILKKYKDIKWLYDKIGISVKEVSITQCNYYKSPTNTALFDISVIIPVYNVEKYINECIDSVLNQSFSNFEIILVNDGSTDNSLNILKDYKQKYDNIVLINQKNSGLATSRNNAMAIAKGKYMLCLDSDDYLREDTLEKLYERMEKHELDMLSFSGVNFVDGNKDFQTNEYWMFRYLPEGFKTDTFTWKDCKPFMHRMAVSSCLTMYRLDFIKQHNIKFPDHLCFEDNVFFIKAITNAKRCGITKEQFYYRRIHSASITQNWAKNFGDYIKISDLVLSYLKSINMEKSVYEAYRSSYVGGSLRRYQSYESHWQEKHRSAMIALLRKYNWPMESLTPVKLWFGTDNVNGEKKIFFCRKAIYHRTRTEYKKRIAVFGIEIFKRRKSPDYRKVFLLGIEVYKKIQTANKTRISILGMPLYSVKKEGYTTTRRILFFKYKKTNRIQLIQDKVWHNQQQIRKLVNELAESRKEIAALRNEVKAASSKPRRFILTEVDDK